MATTIIDPANPGAGLQTELMQRFTSFLDSDHGRGALVQRLEQMVSPPDEETLKSNDCPKRLIVSMDDLRDFDADLARDLTTRPVEHLPIFENAMYELITGLRQDLARDKRKLSEYRIGLDGAFGSRQVSPRGLNANLVGGVVKLEGIVTRASIVRPRLVLSVHYCPITKKFHEKTFRDNASVSSLAAFTQNAGMPGSSYPTKDEDGNPLETEFGRCWYRDSQRLTIQEMPEKSPPGQLPRSIDVLLEGDLCDVCKPGDRVIISGIYRAVGGVASASGTGLFTTFVVANNISLISGTSDGANSTLIDNSIHEDDIRNFISYSSKGKVLSRMYKSIAPSICGHEFIKKAILLLLIGGRERNLANGTHLRGDLNILMVGDPSTAKSQLLRFVMNTAPLAVSTTGRGSSGVGLTAAVTTDQDTNDRHLEAGAMVLADRGVVCIDEFDKMSDEDRVAIHEVMEQQTVTIAKAGIHASLNARCSVVAAANPIYGSYDKKRPPQENIALPDSLMSRFDLLFIVLDVADKERDRQIADHVLRGHKFRRNNDTLDEQDDAIVKSKAMLGNDADPSAAAVDQSTPMYESAASALYRIESQGVSTRTRTSSRRKNKMEDKILSTKFLKQYINYAKHRVRPTLTSEAAEYIANVYQSLRQDDEFKTQHITARCLETLIRLSTAHAKLRLDKSHVTREDAVAGAEVLKFALFNQAEPDKSEKVFRRRSRRLGGKGIDDDDDDDEDNDNDEDIPPTDNLDTNDSNGASASASAQQTNGTSAPSADDDIQPDTRRTRSRGRAAGARAMESVAAVGGSGVLQESAEDTGGSLQEQALTVTGSTDEAGSQQASKEHTDKVKAALNRLRTRDGTVKLDDIVKELSSDGDGAMSKADVELALDDLQNNDIVVVVDGEVFIV